MKETHGRRPQVKRIYDYYMDYLELSKQKDMKYQDYLMKQLRRHVQELEEIVDIGGCIKHPEKYEGVIRHLLVQIRLLGVFLKGGEINYDELLFGDMSQRYIYRAKIYSLFPERGFSMVGPSHYITDKAKSYIILHFTDTGMRISNQMIIDGFTKWNDPDKNTPVKLLDFDHMIKADQYDKDGYGKLSVEIPFKADPGVKDFFFYFPFELKETNSITKDRRGHE